MHVSGDFRVGSTSRKPCATPLALNPDAVLDRASKLSLGSAGARKRVEWRQGGLILAQLRHGWQRGPLPYPNPLLALKCPAQGYLICSSDLVGIDLSGPIGRLGLDLGVREQMFLYLKETSSLLSFSAGFGMGCALALH